MPIRSCRSCGKYFDDTYVDYAEWQCSHCGVNIDDEEEMIPFIPLNPLPDEALFEFVVWGRAAHESTANRVRVLGRGESMVRNIRMETENGSLDFKFDIDEEINITFEEDVYLTLAEFGPKGEPAWFEEYPAKMCRKGQSWAYLRTAHGHDYADPRAERNSVSYHDGDPGDAGSSNEVDGWTQSSYDFHYDDPEEPMTEGNERLFHIIIAELAFLILLGIGVYWELITLVKLVGGGGIFQ